MAEAWSRASADSRMARAMRARPRAAARGREASRVDSESDMRERLGEREEVDPDFPDAVPGADVEGRDGRLPRGAGVDVREFEEDVADAGAPETHSLTLT